MIASVAFVPATTFGQFSTPTEGGLIIVAKATGDVTAVGPDGQTITLIRGSEIAEGYVVETGGNSSVILAFSNGATINLAQDSSLSIDQFLQDPFSDEVSLAELTAEPTTSNTKLHLSRGELVGNVKKLNSDAGSTFDVQTPVGAAGIRGTIFRIVFRPDPNVPGRAIFSLTTAEGNVVLSSGTMDLPAGISVTDNNEVTVLVDVEVDATTGEITVTRAPATPVTVTETSPTTQAEVAVVAQEVSVAAAAVVFTTATSVSRTTTTTTTTEGEEETTTTTRTTDENGDTTTTTTTSPAATKPTPRTTTGDGR